MADDKKKLDSWNAPFDLNRDGKMSPEEKAHRDYTIMNTFFSDDDDDSSGGGCLIPFLLIGGLSGSAIAGIVYGAAKLLAIIKA